MRIETEEWLDEIYFVREKLEKQNWDCMSNLMLGSCKYNCCKLLFEHEGINYMACTMFIKIVNRMV
jgi:hypothetical protein